MSEELPILYSFVRCPYAMRARMVLVEAGINCILREVNLKNKPKELLDISPKATVPVLLLPDGKIIEESLDIMIYASKNIEGLDILNLDKSSQKNTLNLIEDNDKNFIPLINYYKYPNRYPNISADAAKEEIEEKYFKKYDQTLEKQEYLLGAKSLADLAILPFIRQVSKVDEEWFYNLEYKNLIRWVKSFTEEGNFKNLVMSKNKPWELNQDNIYLFDKVT